MERGIPLAPPQNDALTAHGSTARLHLPLIAVGLCAMAAWLLQHPYVGVAHDATLYTLSALAKLHPIELGDDIFLRFGSQDQYTIFSPIYAAAISWIGLEPAAALLTFASQLSLFVCAWLLARRFMSSLAATVGIALVSVVPGEYGALSVFHYLEGFITPRLPAEAFVLGALLAAMSQRYWMASFCAIAAMFLHPIMGAAGAAMLVLTFLVPVRPKLTLVAAAVMLAASLAVLEVIAPRGRVDETWLPVIRATSSYLFVSSWSVTDWSRAIVPLGILALGWIAGAATLLRRVCAGSLAMVACGLAITLLYCDVLHASIFISLQAWRWLWLANVLAFVLAPAIGQDCWRRGDAGRAAVLLLASAWILRGDATSLCIVPAALACAAASAGWSERQYGRAVLLGSCALLLIALVIDMSGRFSYVPAPNPHDPILVQQLRGVCDDGVIPGALVIAVWLALRRSESVVRNSMLVAVAALAGGALIPLGWRAWTQFHYTPTLAGKFVQWRAEIPVHAEVLWPDTPIGAWYLLERPSYLSGHQAAGAIFSREKSLLLQHRVESVNAALKISGVLTTPRNRNSSAEDSGAQGVPFLLSKLNRRGMEAACADPDLSYIASWLHVAPTPFAPVTVDPTKPNGRLYLYRCADLRASDRAS
jgi:hypothetical protein